MKRALLLTIVIALPLAAAPRRRSVVVRPFPQCTVVSGTPAVTFTRDEGRTLAPLSEQIQGTGYTYGVAALDTPGTLLSWHKLTLSISTDDGCSWRPVATAENVEYPPSITSAPGGRAYVWSENRNYIARYDSRGLQSLKAPGAILGVGVDRANGDHVRLGTTDGVVWNSSNAGDTWDPVGQIPSASPLMYRFAFDPANLDHLVAGMASNGAQVSFDGGRTWKQSSIGSGHNAFSIVVSPVDGNVVWAMALNMAESDLPPAHGRHIYRSTDGGLTFRIVVDESPSVPLINGPVMAAHPINPNVLYFVFGTYFQGYGTDLFRYDAGANQLTAAHNSYHDINAIAFSRADPTVMYLGLENTVIH